MLHELLALDDKNEVHPYLSLNIIQLIDKLSVHLYLIFFVFQSWVDIFHCISFVFGLRFYSQKKYSNTNKCPIELSKFTVSRSKLNSRKLGTFF